ARDTLRQMLARAGAHSSAAIPRLNELQRQQQEDALAFFLKIAEQQGDDPAVRYDIAEAYHDVAMIQAKLGQKSAALANLHKAREGLAALAAEFPEQGRYRYEHVRVLLTFTSADLVPRDQAGVYLEQALQEIEPLLAREPRHVDYRVAEATIHMHLGSW